MILVKCYGRKRFVEAYAVDWKTAQAIMLKITLYGIAKECQLIDLDKLELEKEYGRPITTDESVIE